MDAKYDEDIAENPLFKELQTEHSDLLARCIQEGWIICIPRLGTLDKCNTVDDILSHILIPNDELPETHFRSLGNRNIRLSDRRVLTIDKDDTESTFSTHIIFEETFYTEDLVKYKVWCLEAPLESTNNNKIINESCVNNYYTLNTLRDCIDLLWTENLGKIITLINHFQLFAPITLNILPLVVI